jgi:hypothetical protein
MRPSRHPILRLVLFGLGILLVIASPLVGAIPGPGGVFVLAAGLALMLQNSRWAKRQFARYKRRWPKFGHAADWGLRRPSARRRRERDRAKDGESEAATVHSVSLRPPALRDETQKH